jgi:hypothetical protein
MNDDNFIEKFLMNIKKRWLALLSIIILSIAPQLTSQTTEIITPELAPSNEIETTNTVNYKIPTASYDEALVMSVEELSDHFKVIATEVLQYLQDPNNTEKTIHLTFLTELHATTITIKKNHLPLVTSLITKCILNKTEDIVMAYMNSKTMLSVAWNVAKTIGFYWSAQLSRVLIPIWFNMNVTDPKTGQPSSHPDRYQKYESTTSNSRR